jgi:fluoride exporter
MTVVFVVGFALAAGLGGVARWYAARLTYLPEVATFGVNIIGSFLLGLTFNMSEEWQILLGIALIGAFTTFSTFVHDVVRLAREGAAGYLIA